MMFVPNRRVKLPKEIAVDSKNLNNKFIEIKSVFVVTSIKLLGVTIDNKSLKTINCSSIKIVNWKMYSIKRFFYLYTSVKIQFFKTFILSYFVFQ
jgi:hypothetical protein